MRGRLLDRHLEQTAEFARKVHGNARVHGTLSVQEALRTAESEYTFVPDVGVNVESLSATEAEAHKTLRGHVIARERQRDIERPGVEREEELAAVGMIVCVPQQHP